MATGQDLDDARDVFLAELDGDAVSAERIADIIYDVYVQRALAQSRDVVIRAAAWAAAQLRGIPPRRWPLLDRARIVSILSKSDCPLCIGEDGDGDDSGGKPDEIPPRETKLPKPDILEPDDRKVEAYEGDLLRS